MNLFSRLTFGDTKTFYFRYFWRSQFPQQNSIILKKILILFAHPAYQRSRINKVLADGLEKMEGVTFHDLYQQYAELDIDVGAEKELLLQHDIIIFHHPFFWYSVPAILKEFIPENCMDFA